MAGQCRNQILLPLLPVGVGLWIAPVGPGGTHARREVVEAQQTDGVLPARPRRIAGHRQIVTLEPCEERMRHVAGDPGIEGHAREGAEQGPSHVTVGGLILDCGQQAAGIAVIDGDQNASEGLCDGVAQQPVKLVNVAFDQPQQRLEQLGPARRGQHVNAPEQQLLLSRDQEDAIGSLVDGGDDGWSNGLARRNAGMHGRDGQLLRRLQ